MLTLINNHFSLKTFLIGLKYQNSKSNECDKFYQLEIAIGHIQQADKEKLF